MFKKGFKIGFIIGAILAVSGIGYVYYVSKTSIEKSQKISKVKNFNDINIPIMASYQVVKGLTLQAGPQVGFNINAEVYNSDVDLGDDFDLSDETNTVDFGAGLGAQYELDFGLFFQVRYVWGFSNYVDSEDADNETYSNRVGSLSVGYFFN